MNKLRNFIHTYGNAYFFIGFWLILFVFFTLIPILMAVVISFTNFDMVQAPRFIGFSNYMRMFLDDDIFVKAFSNTMLFAIITGPVGYILSFVVAWFINDMGRLLKNILTFLFYSPSLIGSAYLMWTYLFSNDSYGILNSFLINWGLISEPIQWLYDPDYNFFVVIVVVLWMGMGTGFLAFIAGFKQLNASYFEAAAIDGLRNRWQELWYITLPMMAPHLMLSAVLAITATFTTANVATVMTGFPSVNYATHTIMHHLQDYSTIRYERGYASAIATVLFLFSLFANKLAQKFIGRIGK